jgi:glycosyltransferase involved in cell wall biosynthesis
MKIAIFANSDWYLYNFRRGFALSLVAQGFEVLLLTPDGPYVERLQALGLRCRVVPMKRRSLNPFRELAFVRQLSRLLREERVTLIHGLTVKCAIYGSLAGRVAGTPARVNAVAGLGYVFTSTSLAMKALRPLVRRLLKASLSGRNVRLIVQNADDAALFRDGNFVDGNKIRLVRGSGVDCEAFHPPQAGRSGSPLTVLLAARLLWQKGVREYVEAAHEIARTGRPVRFWLAGTPDPGNPNAVDEVTLERWTKEGAIEWLGHVEDMPNLLRSADVFVLPSYYGEGLPKSLIEAAASGCALITTDMPGCRDVVNDGETGLLIPPRDSSALCAAIAAFHDDPELRSKMGVAARRKALAEFDEALITEQTIAVYRELLPIPAQLTVAPGRSRVATSKSTGEHHVA